MIVGGGKVHRQKILEDKWTEVINQVDGARGVISFKNRRIVIGRAPTLEIICVN